MQQVDEQQETLGEGEPALGDKAEQHYKLVWMSPTIRCVHCSQVIRMPGVYEFPWRRCSVCYARLHMGCAKVHECLRHRPVGLLILDLSKSDDDDNRKKQCNSHMLD